MRRFFLFFAFLLVTLNMSAQFKLDTEAYERQKKEVEQAREKKRIQDSLRVVQIEEQRIMANDVPYPLEQYAYIQTKYWFYRKRLQHILLWVFLYKKNLDLPDKFKVVKFQKLQCIKRWLQ